MPQVLMQPWAHRNVSCLLLPCPDCFCLLSMRRHDAKGEDEKSVKPSDYPN